MTEPSFPPRLLRTRLYEQVAAQISAWIVDNGLRAGDKLPAERELAQRLGVSRATLSQAIRLARHLLDPDSTQKLQFRRYVETQLSDDRMRRSRIEGEQDQETPQESLFVLRQSFESLRNLIDHLLQLPVCGLSLFNDVGNLVLREIVLNRYFRPCRLNEFRLEYDRLRSVRLLSLLEAPSLSRTVSAATMAPESVRWMLKVGRLVAPTMVAGPLTDQA